MVNEGSDILNVIAINGSPKSKGNTYYALKTVCDTLSLKGINTEILHIGNMDIRGCMACNACKDGQCIFSNNDLKDIVNKIYEADGLILGSPVYYAGISGTMKSFLDRLFYASEGRLRHKVAASLVIPRRSGGVSAFNSLNQYLLLGELLIAPSYYWNIIHGGSPGEILRDEEGLSILNNLATNMAWLIQMKSVTKDTLPAPDPYPRAWTNFIRE